MNTITQIEENGIGIFTVPEQLTNDGEKTTTELEEKIKSFCENHPKPKVIINLKNSEIINVAGFEALINIKKKMEAVGGQVELANPGDDINLHFEVFGFNHIVKIFNSIKEAKVGFQN